MTAMLDTGHGRRIAFSCLEGEGPGVVFLSGFKSDMTGSKAMALDALCREQGRAFVRFDYSGHGQSSGRFEDGTIGQWKADALEVFDRLTHGPQILVGSSMGGWISLLLARERPERIKALVGLASAPDFTEELIWNVLPEDKKQELRQNGVIHIPSCYGQDPYPITLQLVEEGRNHLLLCHPAAWRDPDPGIRRGDITIPINCPIRLLHGTQDEDVPWQTSSRLLERLQSRDASLTLIKDGNHRLSEPEHLELLQKTLAEVW